MTREGPPLPASWLTGVWTAASTTDTAVPGGTCVAGGGSWPTIRSPEPLRSPSPRLLRRRVTASASDRPVRSGTVTVPDGPIVGAAVKLEGVGVGDRWAGSTASSARPPQDVVTRWSPAAAPSGTVNVWGWNVPRRGTRNALTSRSSKERLALCGNGGHLPLAVISSPMFALFRSARRLRGDTNGAAGVPPQVVVTRGCRGDMSWGSSTGSVNSPSVSV